MLFACLLGSTETTRSLLVHLCTWCNAIDGHHKKTTWSYHVDDAFCVGKDFDHHLLLGFWGWFAFWMCTWMYDTVHV